MRLKQSAMRLNKAFLLGISLVLLAGCGKKDADPARSMSGAQSESVLADTKDDDGAPGVHVVLQVTEPEEFVFEIGDEGCSAGQAKLYLSNMADSYQSVYGQTIMSRTSEGVSFGQKLKDSALSRLVAVKTMALFAAERGAQLDESDEQRVAQAANAYLGRTSSSIRQAQGITDEDVVASYRELALADKVYQQILEETEPEISDDEARIVTVSQILIKTYRIDQSGSRQPFSEQEKRDAYQKALSVLSRLNQGDDFDQVAATANEGDRITVSFGKDEREEAISEAAFALGTDEISRVVETSDGYLIMKCLQSFDREQTDKRKVQIAKMRKEETFSRMYEDFASQLTRALNEEEWNRISIDTAAAPGDEGTNFFTVYQEFFGRE